jgi:hypothetical protein
MALARRFADQRPRILDLLQGCLTDPTPTVRLQVAQSLNALWDIDRDRMWVLVTHVAEHEDDHGVLGFFISGPLQRIAGADADRCERLLSKVLNRLPEKDASPDKRGRDSVEEAAGNLVALLYVKFANRNAWGWVAHWVDDLVRGDPYLWTMLSALRGVFLFGYQGDGDAEGMAMRGRAQSVLAVVVTSAVTAMTTAEPILRDNKLGDPERQAMEALYVAGERLLDQSCNQLYFGSGAFRPSSDEDGPGLLDAIAKQRFLSDYRTRRT